MFLVSLFLLIHIIQPETPFVSIASSVGKSANYLAVWERA